MAVHEGKLAILGALNDVYLHECPDTSSAIIEIVGDLDGEITVDGHALQAPAAGTTQTWGKRTLYQDGSGALGTNIISNNGSSIAEEYQVSTGGQSLRLTVTSYTGGSFFVRVTSSHNKNLLVDGTGNKTDKTVFGGAVVAQNILFVQGSATYDLIPANFRSFTATGGATSAAANTGVEQNFTAVGNNLISDYDITNVALSTGTLLDSTTVSPNGGDKINLKELEISIPPSLNIIVTAQRTGGSSGDVTATLTWYEDI